jgi:hypothetical protein
MCRNLAHHTDVQEDSDVLSSSSNTTLVVIAEVALMEATVHLLDLPEPIAAIEVLAGRADPATAVPAIR